MSKRLIRTGAIALIALAVLGMPGCMRPGALFGGSRPYEIAEQDNGTTAEVPVGQRVAVSLEANPSTGYSWQVISSGPLTALGEPVFTEKKGADPKIVGAGGLQTFSFEANQMGTGELKLEYRRPWEKDVPAEKTFRITLHIK